MKKSFLKSQDFAKGFKKGLIIDYIIFPKNFAMVAMRIALILFS